MSVVEEILETVKGLSDAQQLELLKQAKQMREEAEVKKPKKSIYGLWKDNPPITDEDIAEARREMWGNFPRDNF